MSSRKGTAESVVGSLDVTGRTGGCELRGELARTAGVRLS